MALTLDLEEQSRLEVTFFVSGHPQTHGSKRPVAGKRKDGSVFARAVEGDNDEAIERKKAWRTDIQEAAWTASGKTEPVWPEAAVEVEFVFVRKRPSPHLTSGRNSGLVKDWAKGLRPTTKPDALKLARAAEDALTGVLWGDDAQVVSGRQEKAFGDQVGLHPRAEGMLCTVRDARPYAGPHVAGTTGAGV